MLHLLLMEVVIMDKRALGVRSLRLHDKKSLDFIRAFFYALIYLILPIQDCVFIQRKQRKLCYSTITNETTTYEQNRFKWFGENRRGLLRHLDWSER